MLKLPQFTETRLFEKMRDCLKESKPKDISAELAGASPMLLMKNIKLLIELYQFLPSKKAAVASGTIDLTRPAANHSRNNADVHNTI